MQDMVLTLSPPLTESLCRIGSSQTLPLPQPVSQSFLLQYYISTEVELSFRTNGKLHKLHLHSNIKNTPRSVTRLNKQARLVYVFCCRFSGDSLPTPIVKLTQVWFSVLCLAFWMKELHLKFSKPIHWIWEIGLKRLVTVPGISLTTFCCTLSTTNIC